MGRFLRINIILAICVVITSCTVSDVGRHFYLPHIGTWYNEDSHGRKAVVAFNEDGSGTLEIDNTQYEFEYIFDYMETPVTLDMIYSREGKPFRAKVIVQFLDEDRLKWRTFFNESRPAEFVDDDPQHTIILKRANPAAKV